jgi:hypothetical protein
MKRFAWLIGFFLIAAAASTGCVERRYIVETDQPMTVVLVNNDQLGGQTPVDGFFTYYGNYRFTLIKDGYQTQQVDQDIAPPWFQYPGIDFFAENVWPFMIRDTRHFYYQMQPLQMPNIDEVRDRASLLRARAAAIQPPQGAAPAQPVAPAQPAPPTIVPPPVPPS